MSRIFNFKFSILKEKFGWVLFSGFVLTLVYFLLRVINLTTLPVFADEAIYIRWSQVMKAEATLRFLPLSDGKQPLFMWLMIPFFSFFHDPLFAGRMVSVLAGFGTLIGIFILGLLLFRSKPIAFLSSLLYAVVPFAVFFDRLSLVDSLLAMFGVWTFLLGVLQVRYRRIDLAMVAGFVMGGALLTKSPAMFFILLLPFTALLLDFKSKKWKTQLIKLAGLWLISYFFAFAIYNILRLGPNFQMIGSRNQDYVFSFREVLSHPLNPFMPHVGQVWEWLWSFLGLPLILTFFGGVILGLKKLDRKIFLLLFWFLIPFLIQMAIAKVFTARYIFFTVPYLLLIASFFVVSLKRIKFLMIIVIAAIIVPSLWFNYFLLTSPQKAPLPADERRGYLEEWTSGYGIAQVRDYLRNYPTDKQIIVGTEGSFGTLPDGLQIYFDKDQRVTIIGVGLGLDQISNQLLDSVNAGNPTFLVANKSRIKNSDPRLKLISAYPKAESAKNHDSLLFYKVEEK
ncbi:MAG: glycosyltransferase family 39 protein [bacterium]|nr:glycosyltransferase family 39 protein [bacterium]